MQRGHAASREAASLLLRKSESAESSLARVRAAERRLQAKSLMVAGSPKRVLVTVAFMSIYEGFSSGTPAIQLRSLGGLLRVEHNMGSPVVRCCSKLGTTWKQQAVDQLNVIASSMLRTAQSCAHAEAWMPLRPKAKRHRPCGVSELVQDVIGFR